MPSGSHSSSGGGHFGGGGSFGGGSSSHGGGSFHSRGPMIFIWGGRRYSVPSKQSAIVRILTTLFVFALIFSIFTGIGLADSSNELKKIKADYEYYQSMVQNAEENSLYLTSAKITGRFYNDTADKYYLTYTIKTALDQTLEGETFCTYTLKESMQFEIGESVPVAVDSVTITLDTDSCLMDFKEMPIERLGEYTYTKGQITTTAIMTSIFGVASVGLLVASIVISVKYKELAPSTTKDDENKTQNSQPAEKENTWVCEYCGNVNDNKELHCTQCGAKHT